MLRTEPMSKRSRLDDTAIATFIADHVGWSVEQGALTKTFHCDDYSAAVGLTMRVALAAEKADHHPDIVLKWGAVTVMWSTHDAGGITKLDMELALATDALALG